MDNNLAEKDPWNNMNMAPGNRTGEVSQAGLEREAEWNSVMADAPEFGGGSELGIKTSTSEIGGQASPSIPTETEPGRDESIADASAIINYGLNAAAREKGVETVIQTINNFVPNNFEDPINQLFNDLGIDTKEEISDVKEESLAAKPEENTFRSEDVNAPTTLNKSENGALAAISEVKNLVAEVESSPAYAGLRAEALKAGKGVFEYAVNEYGVRDLTKLFESLNNYKEQFYAPKEAEEEPEQEPNPELDQELKQAA